MTNRYQKIVFLAAGFLIVACASHPGAVNSTRFIPVSSGSPEEAKAATDAFAYRPVEMVISGQAMESATLPIPAPHLGLSLYRLQKGKWDLITELTTETDGSFRISRPLEPGAYELRVQGKEYRGKLSLTLDKKPATDLLMMITKVK